MDHSIRIELEELMSSVCEQDMQELTGQQADRLNQLLKADSECRAWYLDYMDMHARLLVRENLHSQLAPTESAPNNDTHGGGGNRLALDSLKLPGNNTKNTERYPRAWGLPRKEWLRLMLVATATLAASLLVRVDMWPVSQQVAPLAKLEREAANPIHQVFVGTLTRSESCRWDSRQLADFQIGARLIPSDYRLSTGMAQIYLDGGAVVLIEGPANFRIGNANQFSLKSGKCQVSYDQMANPLDFQTPLALLKADFGEYAVTVLDQEEHLRVYDHRLSVVKRSDAELLILQKNEYLSLGPGNRSETNQALSPGLFCSKLAENAVDAVGETNFVADESFDYQDATTIPFANMPNQGKGWLDVWTHSHSRQPVPLRKDGRWMSESGNEMLGGMLEAVEPSILSRDFAVPLRLDTDRVLYFSFWFNRAAITNPTSGALQFVFRDADDKWNIRLSIYSADGGQAISFWGNNSRAKTPLPLRYDQPYRYVGKLVVGPEKIGQFFASVFAADEQLIDNEPNEWMLVSPPCNLSDSYKGISLQFLGTSAQAFDEFRLTTSWSAIALGRAQDASHLQ